MSSDLYLTEEQEQHIITAIAEAEKKTSGEIRVHIESHCKYDPLDRAARIFHGLGMDETRFSNGVLIYIAAEDHKAAVYAGKGIHRQVEDGFWDEALSILLDHFKKDDFEAGIATAVDKVGKKLKDLFPYRKDDEDELPNAISYIDDQDDENA